MRMYSSRELMQTAARSAFFGQRLPQRWSWTTGGRFHSCAAAMIHGTATARGGIPECNLRT